MLQKRTTVIVVENAEQLPTTTVPTTKQQKL